MFKSQQSEVRIFNSKGISYSSNEDQKYNCVFIEVNSKPENRALTLIHSITAPEMFHLCLHHFLIRKLRKVNDHEKEYLV